MHFLHPDSDPHSQQQNSPSIPGRRPLSHSMPQWPYGPPRSGGHSTQGIDAEVAKAFEPVVACWECKAARRAFRLNGRVDRRWRQRKLEVGKFSYGMGCPGASVRVEAWSFWCSEYGCAAEVEGRGERRG